MEQKKKQFLFYRKLALYALFLANLATVLSFWWNGSSALLLSGGNNALVAFGRLAGLLAQFFILFELVLISRASFIEKTFGFDKLNRLHQTVGYYLIPAIFLHPILLVIGYAQNNNVSFFPQFVDFVTNWEDVLSAAIGLAIIGIVGVLSLPSVRRLFAYETWHASHLFIYLAVGLAFGHQTGAAREAFINGDISFGTALLYWYALNFFVFGCVVAYRFFRPFFLYWKHRFYVERVVQETRDVYSVYIAGKCMEEFLFEAGQYIHVSFVASEVLQPHPFSLSAAPNGKTLRISVKALGDFTGRIKDLKSGTPVLLEGPFGKFTEASAVSNKYLFIAGGIGITPIMALTESLARAGKAGEAVLLYGNKTSDDIAFRATLEKTNVRVHHVLSDEKISGYETGYIDREKIMRLVPDVSSRDVFLCGPPVMIELLLKTLRELGVPSKQVHYEKFSY